jgi:hypothetical protein
VSVGGSVTMTAQNGNLAAGDFFNDGFEVVNANVAGAVTLSMGSGAGSTAAFGGGSSASSTTAGSVTLSGSGAGDGAFVAASQINGLLSVSLTGTGTNSISVDTVAVSGDTTLTATKGTANIEIDSNNPGSVFGGKVTITTGGGADSLLINSRTGIGTTTFDQAVSANLGAGNDSLQLALSGQVAFLGTATFNGGTGTNSDTINSANFPNNQPTLINF